MKTQIREDDKLGDETISLIRTVGFNKVEI